MDGDLIRNQSEGMPHTGEEAARDAAPEAARDAEGDPAGERQVSDQQEVRLQRVLDYQAGALAKEDALQANLGSINSGLMRIGVRLDEWIERALAGGPGTPERMQKVLPSIETHLRVTRQVDRLAQIELKAAAPRKPSEGQTPAKPR